MPLYEWKSESTGEEIDVLRSFDDSDVEPTEEEAKGDKGPWQKLISVVTTRRGPNWSGSKGNW
jgi:predicted nucleic acid-binding Zn ribbon protein